MNQDKYSSAHWGGTSQPYPSNQLLPDSHPPTGYHPSSPQPTEYETAKATSYHNSTTLARSSSLLHPVTTPASSSIPRPQSTHPYPYPQGYPWSPSYSQSQPVKYPPPQGRVRPQSPTHAYSPSSPIPIPYPSPPSRTVDVSPQYPASPARPFSCDLCALSFNRQHDLKRHRETHTGEKPYVCNGGCGKTFTRKDALKRHQLVKGCGKIDDSWP